MSRRKGKRFKKQSNSNKIAIIFIVFLLAIVAVSLYFIFRDKQQSNTTVDDSKIDSVNENHDSGISEDEAKEIAIKQFRSLGEDVKKDKLNVIRIQRNGEEFFYISSPNNTIEITTLDGKVIRINSNFVGE